MKKPLSAPAVGIGFHVASNTAAAERTVTLAVQKTLAVRKMDCAACPHMVGVLAIPSAATAVWQVTKHVYGRFT